MKMFKRVLTVCMVVAMLASMLVLASCGLFKSKVEKMMTKIAKADSYTEEYESASGWSSVEKVDLKNLVVYVARKDKDGKVVNEWYMWYDEDADKYYSAEVEENEVEKEELEEEEFFEEFEDFLVEDESKNFAKKIDWEIYEEEDGVFTKTEEEGEGSLKTTYKKSYKVEDNALIYTSSSTFNGTTSTSTTKTYDINKTEIEIPQNVLDAKAEKAD